MKIKKKHYLTRRGFNYETNEDNPILEKWTPKQHDNENVLTLKVFNKDLHVSIYNKKPWTGKRKKRGTIKKFSFGSVKRLRFLLRNTIHKMEYELGLTYPNEFPKDGLIVKNHFHKLRTRLNYYGYKYFWILEFQNRGAPHFHMLVNKEIKKEQLSKMWYAIVGSGDEKHLKRGVHVAPILNKDGMAGYFAQYLSKQEQKIVPEEFKNVGRFWGASRDLLECTIKKYYGNLEDIWELKKQMRPLRRWYEAQKRSWSKRKAYKKKPFKNKYLRPGVAFKVINSNLFVREYESRKMDVSLFRE